MAAAAGKKENSNIREHDISRHGTGSLRKDGEEKNVCALQALR